MNILNNRVRFFLDMEVSQQPSAGYNQANRDALRDAPADLSGYLNEQSQQGVQPPSGTPEGSEVSRFKNLRERFNAWANQHRLLFLVILILLVSAIIILVFIGFSAVLTGRGNAPIRFVPNE